MSGALHLYTDASVRGRLLPPGSKPKRTRRGPGFAAWCGWHGDEFDDCPTFAGQAYLGQDLGTQVAEYGAVVQGLGAAVAYGEVRGERFRPSEVRLYVDNLCVYNLLIGEWRPGEVLGAIHRRASALSARLYGLGMPVGFVRVPESDPIHRVVHAMSKRAPNQVLLKSEWRPSDEPAGSRSRARETASSARGDDDIPF